MFIERAQFRMLKSTLKKVLGIVCVIIGIVGIMAPIIPGIVFIIMGFGLLGISIPFYVTVRRRLRHYLSLSQ